MLKKLLSPQSIALIGASHSPGKLGYDMLSNLKNLGYKGKIYPINPKVGEILGLKVYKSIKQIPKKPDLTLIAIPAKFVNKEVENCAKKGLKNICIISAGFKEIGKEGMKREEDLKKLVKKYKLKLIGPNCLGIINTNISMNASFAEGMPSKGNVSLISQSGAMAVAMIDWAYESGLGFSKIISMGNKAGITENELLEYLGNDPKTKVIALYLESISDGTELMKLAKKISKKKPIIAIKSGISEAGKKAISSHTGSLAGSNIAVTTAFKQCGIIEAESIEELFDYAKAFSYQKPPQGNRTGIITNAGGPGIMASDALSKTKLTPATLSKKTQAILAKGLPTTAALTNPVDLVGDASVKRYEHAIQTLLKSKDIDSLVVILTPQTMTDVKHVASIITKLSRKYPKKTILSAFIGGKKTSQGDPIFEQQHFPNYHFPKQAIQSLEKMWQYSKWKEEEKKKTKPSKIQVQNKKKIDRVFKNKKPGNRLSIKEIEQLLTAYSIENPKICIIKNEKEATACAKTIGYPLVMKIVSKDIAHKTDVGGIRVDIKNDKELLKAMKNILRSVKKKAPNAKIDGIALEPMIHLGKEVIIGCKKDPQFGHLLMFGLGGVYVEILKDVSFRVAPINENEALKMIDEIKAIKILKGARGEKPANLQAIAKIIVKVSQLVTDYPEIEEFEINPLILDDKHGGIAVDARCSV